MTVGCSPTNFPCRNRFMIICREYLSLLSTCSYFVDEIYFSTWYRLRVDVECNMEIVRRWIVKSDSILHLRKK